VGARGGSHIVAVVQVREEAAKMDPERPFQWTRTCEVPVFVAAKGKCHPFQAKAEPAGKQRQTNNPTCENSTRTWRVHASLSHHTMYLQESKRKPPPPLLYLLSSTTSKESCGEEKKGGFRSLARKSPSYIDIDI
jgi:hypothetical protein